MVINVWSSLLPPAVFALILAGGSRLFYVAALRLRSRLILHRLNMAMSDLHFSFEEIVYLPYSLGDMKQQILTLHDLRCECDWSSWMFPYIIGLQIVRHDREESGWLAYLPADRFELPRLQKLVQEGRITPETSRLIRQAMLTNPLVTNAIVNEVYEKIIGR